MEITSTEAQNNFGRYIKLAAYEDIIVTKNGKKAVIIKSYDRVEEKLSVSERADAYYNKSPKITYEEFIVLTESSDNRYEYINGEVFLLASPSYAHQRIITEIMHCLYPWFKDKKCKPLTAPFDVTLLRNDEDRCKNVVQPDILVICDTDKINEKGRYTGTPTLLVEVLSESTRSKDMLKKLDLYASSGILEYWIVDPFKKELYLYRFKDFSINEYQAFKQPEVVKSIVFKGLEIPLEQVFQLP